ncbi:DUF4097 family beta strand repeat-containing protein [Blautia sp. HCP3S3_C4]|uniref:DUF4097 family beta strand repeat-containing protein n=1 Tax=Blautia sp. HCP3S3_C4 TaxID=3438911 RepID=UPI003F8C1F9A
MKKFTKGMLIAAGIFAAAGIGLTAAGGVMGASMSELTGVNSLKRILWMTEWDDDHDDYDDIDDDDYVDHDGMEYSAEVGNESSTDGTVYQLKYQPTKLDIELKYDELILEEGDSFCVRVYDDNGKNVTVKESSDTLKVRSTKKLSKTRKVCISYPEDVKLQELEIEMGAGTVYLNRDIETEKLSVEMGAGEFDSKNPVTAKEADLEIGTGSMTFADLSAKKISGECGLGELDLTMTGTQEDYNYDLECGVGNLDVGSDSYSGLGREKSISNAGADRKLDLECGMGNVSVNFSGKEHRNL